VAARSLQALDADLRARGSRLQVVRGPTLAALQRLAVQVGAEAVFWNRRYEPRIEARDAAIKRALRADGLRAESHNGALLFEPWQLQTKSGDPYRVFTPFWRTALAQWRLPALDGRRRGCQRRRRSKAQWPSTRWDCSRHQVGTRASGPVDAGRTRCARRTQRFVASAMAGYQRPSRSPRPRRNLAAVAAPALRRNRAVARRAPARCRPAGTDRDAFVRELGWREFAHHLLHHFPHTPDANFNPRFDDFAWAQPSRASCRRGSAAAPASRSSTPACASCGTPAGCTTACA
jgi:deoxyribodipyrimidine photo-lyase